MSGQGQQKGQQQSQNQMMTGGPDSSSSGYFSMGNSRRSPFGMDPSNPNANPFARPGAPTTPSSTMPNPLSGPYNGTGNLGSSFGSGGSGVGSSANQPNSQYQPTAPSNNNPDPNSPEYAAYYYGLAPSTRAYLAPPGSNQASAIYNNYNNAPTRF